MLLLVMLIASFASATYAATDVECYSCHGILVRSPICGSFCKDVPDVNKCGERLDVTKPQNTSKCNGVCETKTTYHMDEKIYVDRGCVPKCEDGCFLTFGTGACFSCCTSDRCNAADRTPASLWLLGMAVMATTTALRLIL